MLESRDQRGLYWIYIPHQASKQESSSSLFINPSIYQLYSSYLATSLSYVLPLILRELLDYCPPDSNRHLLTHINYALQVLSVAALPPIRLIPPVYIKQGGPSFYAGLQNLAFTDRPSKIVHSLRHRSAVTCGPRHCLIGGDVMHFDSHLPVCDRPKST